VPEAVAQVAFEIEEPSLGVERVVGGVVERDPVTERADRRSEMGATHRREIGERGAHEEARVVAIAGRAKPCGDVTDEVHGHQLARWPVTPRGRRAGCRATSRS
jgi:hypothetical protein